MLGDFIVETASNPGTGTINLGGVATGPYNTFASRFSTGATVFYTICDSLSGMQETGIGTLTTGSPDTLSRDTVLANTAGNTSKLNFTNTVFVFNAVPASKAIFRDGNGDIAGPILVSGTISADDIVGGAINSGGTIAASGAIFSGASITATDAVSGNGINSSGTLTSADKLTVASGGADVTGPFDIAGTLHVSDHITGLNGAGISGQVSISGGASGSFSNMGSLYNTGVATGVAGTFIVDLLTVNAIVGNGVYSYSDRREKSDIQEITAEAAIDWVMSARPVTYMKRGLYEAGFIAQDDVRNGRGASVQAVPDPREIYAEGDGIAPSGAILIKNYLHEIAHLTAALQDALRRISEIERRLADAPKVPPPSPTTIA